MTESAWTCDYDACPICTSPERDEMTVLRCALLTLLDQGRWMAGDDIPLPDFLSAGGDYLSRLRSAVGGGFPVPTAEQWAWLDAELRLVVARAAGLDAVSTLDPRIDKVLATAARRTSRRQVALLDLAAEQFTELYRRPRTA
ncbi:hypothetical protein [Streptomyces sp. PVA_94-07]|uniref:hypothetical protein n=1 Tax=Streptomyces sp. PVA_94-07 TaxID=1225337 RepID=UPI00131A46B5|nr:hypothetical protein [Streptomyces sp. PVA_94-07]